MARPKTTGKRRGGRNAQFFDGLSGLARALDNVITTSPRVSGGDSGFGDSAVDKVRAAQEKRERKAAKRRRDHGAP